MDSISIINAAENVIDDTFMAHLSMLNNRLGSGSTSIMLHILAACSSHGCQCTVTSLTISIVFTHHSQIWSMQHLNNSWLLTNANSLHRN